MTASATSLAPAPSRPPKVVRLPPPRRTRDDREFLPSALEILETPPAPMRSALSLLLCGLIAAGLAWGWLARLDIHAVAPGRIQVSGRSKVVQPLEPGRVQAVLIENGAHVTAGQGLVEIEATDARADVETLSRDVELLAAQIVRRKAALAAAGGAELALRPAFPAHVREEVRAVEEVSLAADLSQLAANRDNAQAQAAQVTAQRRRLAGSLEARKKLVSSLNERVDMREALMRVNAGSRAQMLEALQQAMSEGVRVTDEEGQLAEIDAAAAVAAKRLQQVTADFVAAQSDKLNEAERNFARARQDLIKASARAERTRLVAPIDGTVQQLAVTTAGQVVMAGQPLLVVVPDAGALQIEAYVPNRDIGFVKVGQEAVVKVDAFPFTRYGSLKGRIVQVSRDAVSARDVQGGTDAVGTAQGRALAAASETSPLRDLTFPVTVAIDQMSLEADGAQMPLSPGMTATVEMRTGDQRALDYLLSPLRQIASGAGHER